MQGQVDETGEDEEEDLEGGPLLFFEKQALPHKHDEEGEQVLQHVSDKEVEHNETRDLAGELESFRLVLLRELLGVDNDGEHSVEGKEKDV